MSKLTSLAKETAVYGISSIVGRFLNYLLVPLYTTVLAAKSGGYGVVTNIYSYDALFLVILTYGMETGYFYFANKKLGELQPDTGKKDTSQSGPGQSQEASTTTAVDTPWRYTPAQVYGTTLCSVAITSILFVVLVLGFLPYVASELDYSTHPEYVAIMAVVVALDAFMAIPYAHLRYEKKAMRFATLKFFFICCGISLQLFFLLGCPWLMKHASGSISWFYRPDYQVGYIFIANLLANGLQFLAFVPGLLKTKWTFHRSLLKQMLHYSFPILIFGVAGVLSKTIDRLIFPKIYPDHAEALVQLGIYGACAKVAMIMGMLVQAFRFAYEPFVFGQKKTGDAAAKKTYADAMKYFCIFSLLAFLGVNCYIDLLRYLVSPDYWEGLKVIPVVMTSEFLVGIYFNLSFWYKLIEQTKWGAYFSIIGCAIILLGNYLFVPYFSYWGSAWSAVAGYGVIALLSYFVGQHYYPIAYPLRRIGVYILMAAVIFGCYQYLQATDLLLNIWIRLGVKTLLLCPFVIYLLKVDLPLGLLLKRFIK